MGRELAELGHSGSFTHTPSTHGYGPRGHIVPRTCSRHAKSCCAVGSARAGPLAEGALSPHPLDPRSSPGSHPGAWSSPWHRAAPLLAPAAWEPSREARPLFPGICVGPGRSAIAFLKLW